MTSTYLAITHGTSRGRETYGYNIVTATDTATGKKYRTMGGGYDMVGTVVADYLCDAFQPELQALARTAAREVAPNHVDRVRFTEFYGMREHNGAVHIDGACGINSVESIARAVGLTLTHTVNPRGHLTGIMVSA